MRPMKLGHRVELKHFWNELHMWREQHWQATYLYKSYYGPEWNTKTHVPTYADKTHTHTQEYKFKRVNV